MNDRTIKLSQAKFNKKYFITEINLPRVYFAKLYKTGVVPKEIITLNQRVGKSALIINVCGAKIALGKEITENIFIEEVVRDKTN